MSAVGQKQFLTGVVFNEIGSHDLSYVPGEGAGGVSVSAQRVGGTAASTATWGTGGYTLGLDPGLYDVTFSGAALASPVHATVEMGTRNVKLDIVDGATVRSSATTILGDGATHLDLLGDWAMNATGNAAPNHITGGAGDNILNGGGGIDMMAGGLGDDTYVNADGETIIEKPPRASIRCCRGRARAASRGTSRTWFSREPTRIGRPGTTSTTG
jgi:Ca2+-binding RTX toxin-like protein